MKFLVVIAIAFLSGCALVMEPPCERLVDLPFYTGDDSWDQAACRRVRDQQDQPEPDLRPDPMPPAVVSPVEEPPNDIPEL